MTICRRSGFLLTLVAGVFLSATTLPASPILNGSFIDIGGTVTVVGTTAIDWTAPPGNQANVGGGGGSFSPLVASGQTVTIDNLTNPPDVVGGGGFPNQTFIVFPAAFSLPDLMINFIAPGVFSSAACGLPAAAGQTCTLPGSPFSFLNSSASSSSATFNFSGITSDGHSAWRGIFTSQFNESYQGVFSTLATTGMVINTYSATITVSSIPEPSPGILIVLGVCGIVLGSWRRKRVVS
jgi:hypothetical protein